MTDPVEDAFEYVKWFENHEPRTKQDKMIVALVAEVRGERILLQYIQSRLIEVIQEFRDFKITKTFSSRKATGSLLIFSRYRLSCPRPKNFSDSAFFFNRFQSSGSK